jgi:anti-sigma B factor antagonist
MSPHPHLPQYEVEIVSNGSASIVRVSGEFDMSAAEHLRDRLSSVDPGDDAELVLDLRETTFMDSSGVGVIVELWNQSREDGFDFSVLPGDGPVRQLLELTGLTGSLPIIENIPSSDGSHAREQ